MDSFGFPEPGEADFRVHFCHQCQRDVALLPSVGVDSTCPLCRGGFLEEADLPPRSTALPALTSPMPGPLFPLASADDPFLLSPPSPIPSLLSRSSNSFELPSPTDLAEALGPGGSSAPVSPPPAPFSPLLFLQDYMRQLVAGGHIGTGNLGDYYMAPDVEQLIQHLAENDPNVYGTPPAAKSAIESLPIIKVSAEVVGSDEIPCAVCEEVFEIGDYANQMPCKHIYHKDCILPWLELHSSCPICRYELPTDDPDYEQRKGAPESGASPEVGNPGGSATEASSERNPPRSRRLQRSDSISTPWSLGVSGVHGNTAGIGDGHDGNTSNGNAGANSGQQEDIRSDASQED
ncbi:E3 ubiquitin-protein ligase [Canna indica]|uniref:RING-type E3 ubiquitin transferase n=1 Tax=Canna indica TaxID=4628 RepID=A0AAQ3QRS0_9LILI|nr:E3 ubiquitin-protein ligase [Canna indica]